MNKPKLIICTVGTSVATNQKINIEAIENRPLAEENNMDYEIKSISQRIKSGLSNLDLSKKEDLDRSSAEIKSLVKIGMNKADQIYLFCAETIDGRLCGNIVKDYIKNKYDCNVFVQIITGLQVLDGERFQNEGIHKFLGDILNIIEPNIYFHDIILNPTGGFKAIVSYTTIIGMLFGLPVKYIFEKSDQLLNFPLIPLEFNLKYFDLIDEKLEKLEETGILNSDEFWRGIKIDYEDRRIFSGIIEESGGLVDFSPIGRLLYHRYKEHKGVEVYLSTKAKGIYHKLQGRQKESIDNYLRKMRDPIFRQQHLHSKFNTNIDAKCYGEPRTAIRIFYYEEDKSLKIAEIFIDHDAYERFLNQETMRKENYTFST